MRIQTRTQPILVLEHSGQLQAHLLGSDAFTIGRSSDADLCILHGQVSRCQAVIQSLGEDRFLLMDGDGRGKPSRNGTFVNWEPVHRHLLQAGDVICFGSPAAVAHFCWMEEEKVRHQHYLESIRKKTIAGLAQTTGTLSCE